VVPNIFWKEVRKCIWHSGIPWFVKETCMQLHNLFKWVNRTSFYYLFFSFSWTL
jgi:hypothetical protein